MNAMPDWPQYCCAILEDAGGRLLLESRSDDARLAAGKLTCFGGRREDDESPEACLRRELREELNWEPAGLAKQLELWVGGELIAWFYHAVLDGSFLLERVPPAHKPIFVTRDDLANLPVSPWHAAVLDAWLTGKPECVWTGSGTISIWERDAKR
jgi:8-oxo-dGTP pyrophosphatase MutT (NUDIX family)